MLYYCKKCGRIVIHYDKIEMTHNCDCCKSKLYKVPDNLYESNMDFIGKNNPKANKLREELVKTSPEFDQYLFDHRDEILARKNLEFDTKMAIGEAIKNGAKPSKAFKGNFSVAKCPSCGSTNISKISTLNRAFSVRLFGLASSKIGKTHKCNSCGNMW